MPSASRVVSLACAVLAVVGCASGCTSEQTSTPGTTVGSGGAVSAGSGGPCAWPVRADKATLNVAYPDTGATYWGLSYHLAPGESIELHGTFATARYLSFITYGANGGAIDTVTDRDLVPDEGTSNPFAASGSVAAGTYTLVLTGDSPGPTAPNVIHARADAAAAPPPPGSAAGSTAGSTPGSTAGSTPGSTGPIDQSSAGGALIGSGGEGATGGTVLYRVYLPGDPGDPTGGVGLPAATLVHGDGARTSIPACATPAASPRAIDIVNANGPPTDRPAPEEPIFIRPAGNGQNLYPNPDNVYIATITSAQPGRIVVLRFRAPTFPDPADGRPIGSGEQVRYWSVCTNEYRKPYPVSFCVADQDAVIGADGAVTVVISTPGDRPANATEANGITWLDWGSTDVDMLVLVRHMLGSPDFPESATNLAPQTLATASMGAYAPRGAYCTKAIFEAGGPEACPASAG